MTSSGIVSADYAERRRLNEKRKAMTNERGTGLEALGFEGDPLFMVQSKQVLGRDKVNCSRVVNLL